MAALGSSLLRRFAVEAGGAVLAAAVLAASFPGLAAAAAYAPDPSPAPASVQPDPYPSTRAPAARTELPAVTSPHPRSTAPPPVRRIHPNRRRRTAVPTRSLPRWHPPRPLAAIDLAPPPAEATAARRVSRALAVALALVVLASGAFVTVTARRVAR